MLKKVTVDDGKFQSVFMMGGAVLSWKKKKILLGGKTKTFVFSVHFSHYQPELLEALVYHF